MKPDLDIESKVIENFVIESKRDRYLTFVKKPKTRKKFINELAHFSSQLDRFEEIKKNEWNVINQKLDRLNEIADCYVISENREIDGKRMKVDQALSETIGMGMGTLIVFGNAEVVFYEGEGPSDRWIKEVKK
jgi:hypothetical protein